MDAQTCLKKLQCVGVLNFSTVGLDGTPQARCISAIHYTSDALYFFTARGKEFCRELLHDGQVQILAYTRYKEMIRVSAKAVPVPEAEQKRCIDLIFQEQPYLSNVYPGATREIGIVFVARDIRIEYFHLGVKPIFRETYTLGKGKRTPKGYEITGECIGCGKCAQICPQQCVAPGTPYRIAQEHCLHCGNCFEQCPVQAVTKKNLRCSMNGKEKQRLRRGRKAETMLRARTRTEKDVFSKTERLKQALETADAVLIGAGAGLSASAGFTYSGERFHRYFSDFEAKYGFHDMYSGGFYAYPTPEEHWAYWSRYIQVNRYEDAPRPVYDSLYRLISEKDYFVLTTNVDHCFQKAGFDKKRLFYTQGDYGLLQCCEPCHRQTYDNRALILRMVEEQKKHAHPHRVDPAVPEMRKAHGGEPAFGRPFCRRRRLAESRRPVCGFSAPPRWHAHSPLGDRRRIQHPGHHQISFLADDRAKSKRSICLFEQRAGCLPRGDPTAVHLHRRRRGHTAAGASRAGGVL